MATKGRNLKKIEDTDTAPISREVDAAKGSHLWAYNHFRSHILTNLLNDLIDMENTGLEEAVCSKVRKSLEYFINASTNVPSGGFLSGGPLYLEIEKFAEIYKQWNDINGKDPIYAQQRKNMVSKLRKHRQGISNKIRKLQYEIEHNYDQKVLASAYTAIGDIISFVPGVFKNLASSHRDYTKAIAKASSQHD